MKLSKNKIISLIAPVAFLAFGIWVYLSTRTMRGTDGIFPSMVAILIIAISIVDFIVELRKDNHKDRFADVNWIALLSSLAAMCLYVFLFKKIGFFFDTLWLTAATMLILGYRRYGVIAISSLLITGAVFGVFYFLMHVPFPTVIL